MQNAKIKMRGAAGGVAITINPTKLDSSGLIGYITDTTLSQGWASYEQW